ncbi:hypothetical protein ACU686_20700 [Yinghuangia aomiensis]
MAGGLGGVGVLLVRSRTEVDAETARVWRENAEAERARAERLDAAVQELARRVDRLEAENAALRSVISADQAITDLAGRVDQARAEILAAVSAVRPCAALNGPVLGKD